MKRSLSAAAVILCLLMCAFHVEKSGAVMNAHADFGGGGHGGGHSGGFSGGGHTFHSHHSHPLRVEDFPQILGIVGIGILAYIAYCKLRKYEERKNANTFISI